MTGVQTCALPICCWSAIRVVVVEVYGYTIEPGANLREADLQGADLSKGDLREADLGGANLHNADLRMANLSEANLAGACLWSTDLTGADLSWAYLEEADLCWARLAGADLSCTDLVGTHLAGAYFLPEATLLGAKAAANTTWPKRFKPAKAGVVAAFGNGRVGSKI